MIVLCAAVLPGTAIAQNELQPNAVLLHDVIVRSADRIAGELPENSRVIVSVRYDDYAWFIHHRFVEALSAAGLTVTGEADETPAGFYRIEMGVERFGMRYASSGRRSLFGTRRMTRYAEGSFSFRIAGNDGERVVRFSESISNVIPAGKRDEVENQSLPFTQAELPGGSVIERYLGPAVIVAATGVVVYLFFSVRS